MSFLTKETGPMKDIFKFSQQPKFENPSLIVGWNKDAGQLSPRVIEYLNKKINSRSFCEIEPIDFFSLAGVTIEGDIAQFPESKFYYGQKNDLVIFKGSEPAYERHRFLNAITDLAQHYYKVKQIYTISGTICSIAHTDSRKILAVFNEKKLQEELREYGLVDMNWQGTPATSSFLLWIAQKKEIPGVSLWTQIPFYLAASEDFQAIKQTLSFLDKRFNLELDLKELDEQILEQNTKIEQLRQQDAEINRCIGALESGLSLSEEEQLSLIKSVSECLEFGKS
jgi:proteasome assembly chaperone (PAC2) family protein